ncbi:hypothetical protein GFM13_19165 [Rhizobium leguminosarum bv. viciae]|nr:hypothetical protein [Rhizobium leguminosarum bv. viciae]
MTAVPATFDFAPPSQPARGYNTTTMGIGAALRVMFKVTTKVTTMEWPKPSPTSVQESSSEEVATVTEGRVTTMRLMENVEQRYSYFQKQLQTIASRQIDWDGDNGRAPSARATEDAQVFLAFLRRHCSLPHSIFAPGDGEINFEWKARKRFTEVGFIGDGTVSWYHRDSAGEIFRDEDFDASHLEANVDLLKVLDIDDGTGAK